MMTSSRPRNEISSRFTSRRGHASQLSISDPSHHVTEAIGTLYGDEDDSGSDGGRPLSFVGGSPHSEQLQRSSSIMEPHEQEELRQQAGEASRQRSVPEQPPESSTFKAERGSLKKPHPVLVPPSAQRSASPHDKSPVSPTLSLRDMQADAQFPLTNIDNPSDIAQELSNLQALRRLSMDVSNYIDPDMPPTSLAAMSAAAPSGDDDENDPSRLLWVPARVHPELAPTEFKSFLEKRVQSIRRQSGDPFLAMDGDSSSASSLRRNKSTLSRQIDNTGGRAAVDYVDGAERLERQRSSASQHSPEVSLDELANDPRKAVQRIAQESHGVSRSIEGSADDMPILPVAPGKGLRRSTRTTYRKGGSFRSGDRGSHLRRLVQRQSDGDCPETRSMSPPEAADALSPARTQTESTAETHSRTARPARRHNNLSKESLPAMPSTDGPSEEPVESRPSPGRTALSSANVTSKEAPLPQERIESPDSQSARAFPQRSSSQKTSSSRDQHPEPLEEASTRPGRRPANNNIITKQASQPHYSPLSPNTLQMQTVNDTLASPSSLSGGDASRTDSLTFIPTLTQPEKKSDKRSKKDRDESGSTSSRSGSAWKWFKGVTDDRDKKKDESKKSKTRAAAENSQDNVRLDVMQTSIDKNSVKGRESLVLDRENIDSKLTEERKKESNRRSDSKKDKDGSIFSSIFGGSKKKEDKEKANKKSQHLQVPLEDIPYKPLTPDVDYNWTRFPLLEERAIYRMAHIKLANPRRSLLSQVLLSNFMYSYLAIVQVMHPQMNVPTSPQQKRLEDEARRKRQEQEYLARRQMQGDQDVESGLEHYNLDYHRATVQYAESDGQADYVDDAQIYEDEHGDERPSDYGYEGIEGYSRDTKDYQHTRESGDGQRRHGRDDMW